MKKYAILEGPYADKVHEVETLEEALEYIDKGYGAENVVEQLIEIEIVDADDGTEETLSFLEVYDMLAEKARPYDGESTGES